MRLLDFAQPSPWVLVYHHDCPKCQEVLPAYRLEFNEQECRVAIVEVPPYGFDYLNDHESDIRLLRLEESRDWFVTAPVEIAIEEGVVVNIESCEFPANEPFSKRDSGRHD